jgi:environmental stress-induced protein Ves
MRIQTIDEQPTQAWKNGGGITRTLVQDPRQVPPAWRISVADIHGSSAFSRFENTQRISVLLHGAGLQLRCADTSHRLHRTGSTAYYDGADPTEALLATHAARLLNVMFDPGCARAVVVKNPAAWLVTDSAATLLLVAHGAVELRTPGAPSYAPASGALMQGQYLQLDKPGENFLLQATTSHAVWVVVVVYQLRGGA